MSYWICYNQIVYYKMKDTTLDLLKKLQVKSGDSLQ